MALLICTGCTTSYAVGAPKCPQCGSTDYVEEGQDMPKLTVHGGATNAADEPEGGEQPSPGNNSSASSERAPRSRKKNAPAAPSPAPTTESPSPKDQTANSSASGTDGDQTGRTSGGNA